MAVQRYPDAGMLPTSQEGGGTVHDQSHAMTAPGSAPGFDGGVMTYPVSTDAPPAPPVPDRDDRWLAGESGAKAPQGSQDSPFPQAGSFAQADREDSGSAGLWKLTPSSS
jgi:hypothetical protein